MNFSKFGFSTVATLGQPVPDFIDEDHPQNPINPYGQSKLMIEHVFNDYAAAYVLRSAIFRHFNDVGAEPPGDIVGAREPETHVIVNILHAVP